jgi:hypothetical protein
MNGIRSGVLKKWRPPIYHRLLMINIRYKTAAIGRNATLQGEKPMTEGHDFRRTYERKNYSAEVLFSHKQRMYNGTVRNISLGGAFIETAESHKFALGDRVILSIPFTDGGKHIKREGRIKWKARHGFAVAFS